MTCPRCGAAGQPDGAKFCSECGTGLRPTGCPACGAATTPGAKFCSECGAPQREGGGTAAAPVASRRVTSVLFGDLVGFTSLSESRDQEDVRELLSRYFEECRRIVDRYGGTVEKFIGDAVMAVWGVPTAHEDDAERSVRAGLELVNRIEAMGGDVGAPELAMRVGIVTGEVAVTIGAQAQGMVAGDAVNTAARVQSAASPGQVWVDETTRLLTSSAISYVDVGSHTLKGKLDPVPLWSVRAVVAKIGGGQRADGLEAPHVGRDRELRLVKDLYHGVEESGRPAMLIVEGEAGVGKTRLGWEFSKYTDGLNTTMRWHSGRCVSYGEGVAFYALAEAIRGRLQLVRPGHDGSGDADLTDEDQARLLTDGLAAIVTDEDERAWLEPRLGALLGIGAVGSFQREDLFTAWTEFLHRVGNDEEPVVLVIDDAQHADDGLVSYLEHLMTVATFPVYVVLLARPGLLAERPSLVTNRRVTVVHLEVLPERDMGSLLDGLVSGLPAQVRASLVERAEGVPLFAVETVRSLIDRDLVLPRGGQYVLADPDTLDLDAIAAPASLQALIAARLDTLPPTERVVVDRASIIGDFFTRDAIAGLCPDVEDLGAALAGLVRSQILRQESDRFSAERGQYQFVQGAVRQVAHGMISRRDRKAGHLALVSQLEAGDNSAGELSPIIAQHLQEAYDAVPDAPDRDRLAAAMVDHLERAAERAASLGAPAEAAGHLGQALEHVTEPEHRARIECELADQSAKSGMYDEAVARAEKVVSDFEALGDPLGSARATGVLCDALRRGPGDLDRAMLLAEAALERIRDRGDHATELRLTRAIVGCRMRLGLDTRDLCDAELRIASLTGSGAEVANSYISIGLHYLASGPVELARIILGSAAEISGRERDTVVHGLSLLNLASSWLADDVTKAVEVGREGVAVCRASGDSSWSSGSILNLATALLTTGDWDEALDILGQEVVADTDLTAAEFTRGWMLHARGVPWTPRADYVTQGGVDDMQVVGYRGAIEALTAHARGRADANELSVRVAEQHFSDIGMFDDFAHFWFMISSLVLETGDSAALKRLLELAEGDGRNRRPTGLEACRQWVLGRVAVTDGAEPAVVERHLRVAAAGAADWGSPVLAALVSADLACWLLRQGRAADATEPLAQARRTFDVLGATRWSDLIDQQLAGVGA